MPRIPGSQRLIHPLLMLLVGLTICTAPPARADDDSGWRLRIDFAVVDPSDDPWRAQVSGGTVVTEFDTGYGFGARGEYQFSRRLGVDFGFLSTASVDVTASVGTAAVDVDTFSPFTVGLDIHLTPGKRVDLYAGPQVAWIDYGDVEVSTGPGGALATVSIDRDVGLAAIVGLDVPLGEKRHWAFQTNLRYFATSMEGDDPAQSLDVDFDPVVFSVGFGYRW